MGSIGLILIGLTGLVIGGELLVRGAVSSAKSFRIPPLVIGLTFVGFGTSSPELVTSIQAALSGSDGIAIGNVVGSNIGNILLILGVVAVFAPVKVDPAAFKRDGSVLIFATVICALAVLIGQIGHIVGGIFIVILVTYLVFTIATEQSGEASEAAKIYQAEAEAVPGPDYSLVVAILLAIFGLCLTILGARFLVSGSIQLAQLAGISETVIGLTIVAIGTSMPELVTSIVAIRKGQADVAFGNVIGSNIFNIFGILGITAVVAPLTVPSEVATFDIWVMCFATVAMVIFAKTGWRIARREGAFMLSAYWTYTAFLLLR